MSEKHPNDFTPRERFHCATPVQLRFNDVDALGHVNNSIYFQLFDLGKTHYFELAHGKAIDWNEVNVMAVNVNCDFLEQTRHGEPLQVLTRVASIGNKSFVMEQVLVNTATGHYKSVCRTVMVHIDLATGAPSRVSDDWRDAITAMEHPDRCG